MTANITTATISNKTAGAKFSIAWLQDGTGGRTVAYDANVSNACLPTATANITTTQAFEVAADGVAVIGTGCTDNSVGIAPQTLTDGATITWSIAGPWANATVTLGGNRTLNITTPVTGGNYLLRVVQDGTGSRTLTPGTGCTWIGINGGGGTTFPLSTTASAKDLMTFYYDGTFCYVTIGKAYTAF